MFVSAAPSSMRQGLFWKKMTSMECKGVQLHLCMSNVPDADVPDM